MSSRKLGRLMHLITALALASAGCSKGAKNTGGSPEEELGATNANLLAEGRWVTISLAGTEHRLPTFQTPNAAPQFGYNSLFVLMEKICGEEFSPLATRGWYPHFCADTAKRPGSPPADIFIPTSSAPADQLAFRDLCLGHKALEIATSTTGAYFYAIDGKQTFTTEAPPPEVTHPTPPALPNWWAFPVADPSDAASWAMFAADRFRDATGYFKSALTSCSGQDLEAAPTGDLTSTKYGVALASGLADALSSMMEAAEVAEKRVLAASQAKRGNTSQETVDAVKAAWRDRHDSRLEVASLWGPIATRNFEPDADAGVPMNVEDDRYPVATLKVEGKGDLRAEELIRSTRVNPCLSGMGGWCAEALAGAGTRMPIQLALDIHRAMQARGGNAAAQPVGDGPSATAFLRKNGVNLADLELAARRIVQHAEVMGQAIVPDPDAPGGTTAPDGGVAPPALVLGTVETGAAPASHYLFARTVGAAPWGLFDPEDPNKTKGHVEVSDQGTDPNASAFSFSSFSIGAAASEIGMWLDSVVPSNPTASNAPSNAAILAEVRALANEFAGNSTLALAMVSTNSGAVSQVLLISYDQNIELPGAINDVCSIWVGEAGLECGLTGQINGGRCDTTRYRVNASLGHFYAAPAAGIEPSMMPARAWVNGGTPGFAERERFYWTCDMGDRREVVMALELSPPPTLDGSMWSVIFPPMSKSALQGISRTLAADPAKPEQSALSCAGVPYNAKLALEDEITEALTGQDGIESSFAYYLKLARDAATRADDLGDQLVEHGLQMDLRAEQAREALEDLCGGIVDVAKLEAAACQSHRCDIVQMLVDTASDSQTNGVLGVSESELSGVRACLGIAGGGKPVWAALGDQDLCVPQFYPAPGTPLPPPGVCPASAAVCANFPTSFNPTVLTCANTGSGPCTCSAMYGDRPEYAEGTRPETEAIGVRTVKDKLNLFITAVDTKDVAHALPGAGPSGGGTGVEQLPHPCQNLMALRSIHTLYEVARTDPGALGLAGTITIPTMQEPSWANLQQVNKAAEVIGYSQSVYGIPTVTIGGRPWATAGSSQAGFNGTDWPCGPAPWVRPEDCSAWTSDAKRPLACGLSCNNINGPLIRQRLSTAVDALKGITGASYDNVFETVSQYGSMISYDSMRNAGTAPAWFGVGDLYASDDGTRLAYWTPPSLGSSWSVLTQVQQRKAPGSVTVPVVLPGVGLVDRALLDGGWIEPNFLWELGTCVTGRSDEVVLGCGDMRRLIRGESVPEVRSQIAFNRICPQPGRDPLMVDYESCTGSGCGSDWSLWQEFPSSGVPGYAYGNGWQATRDFSITYTPRDEDGLAVGQCKCRAPARGYATHLSTLVSAYQRGEAWARTPEALPWTQPFECQAATAGTRVPWSIALDALELACMATSSGAANCDTLLRTPLKVESVEDFPKVRARIECAARSGQESLDRMFLAGVPKDVVTALGSGGPGRLQSFPGFRGEYGTIVAELGAKLISLRAQADSIVQKYRDIGSMFEVSRLESQVTDLQIASDTVDGAIAQGNYDQQKLEAAKARLRTRQAISNAVTTCINAMIPSSWTGFITGEGYAEMARATNTCVNSGIQIASEQQIQSLDGKILDIQAEQFQNVLQKVKLGQQISETERNLMFQRLAIDIAAKLDEMHLAGAALSQTQAEIHGHLAQLDSIRNQARREASKVLMLSNDDLGRAYGVNSTMRARMNTLRVRYERAREDAIRLAYLARRSVEQRLGVDMSLMEDDMTLVPAPRAWVDKLCTLSGIDYEKIRQGGTSGGTVVQTESKDFNYADNYIGDWLTKLENFIESYRLDYPFQDGGDIAVVSLRDELARATKSCELPGWNQLFYTDGAGGLPQTGTVVDPATRSEISRTIWARSCNDHQQASTDPIPAGAAGGVTPFKCASAELGNCRALGDAQGVYLSLRNASCEAVATSAGSVPLPEHLVYHYDASTCEAGAALHTTVCTDQSPANRDLVLDTGTAPTLLSNGAGGRPALRVTSANTTLVTSPLAFQDYAYSSTATVVVHRGLHGKGAFLGSQYDGDGSLPYVALELSGDDNYARAFGAEDLSEDSRNFSARAEGIAPRTQLVNGVSQPRADIYTVRTSYELGIELFLNGALVAHTPSSPVAQDFGRVAAFETETGGFNPIDVSAMLAYSSRLTDLELANLHQYLSARFNVPLKGPSHWLSGDVLAELGATGSSATSGQSLGAASSTLRDAVTGVPAEHAGGIEAAPLTTLGGHAALAFDGVNDDVWFRSLGQRIDSADGVAYTTARSDGISEYTVTLVAQCDGSDGRDNHFFRTSLDGTSGDIFRFGSQGETGKVRLENSHDQAVYLSPQNGDLPCGVPVVVSLRGSASEDSMQVFVNGTEVMSHGEYWPVSMNPSYGDDGGFRGAIAESQVHLRRMGDLEIQALHAQLGAKYSIAGIPAGDGGPQVAVAGPARLLQSRSLNAGEYWISWHQRIGEPRLGVRVDLPGKSQPIAIAPGASATVQNSIWPAGPENAAQRPTGAAVDTWLAAGWLRYIQKVTVPIAGEVSVGFVPPTGAENIAFAAPQVERNEFNYSTLPKDYFATSSTLNALVDKCEDTGGDAFRAMWERGCEYYCPPGAGTDCSADGEALGLPKHCYYEFKFPIALEAIEKGELIPAAGFARGNFNYRFDQMALNFVGTRVKDCQGSSLRSSCYGANFLQYSLRHSPPYRIRNYEGDVIDAPLFTGNVQQAKGLLAERYVSNPVSSTDETLLRDYWREEFRGRPIDGNFSLRVYETDGLNFSSLKDVQLLLRYRYWTRFE